ncbi:MAG: hypothetical protein ACQET1_10110 [Gemmatimonadota bacterium]
MRRLSLLPPALAFAGFLWACAGNPGPGEAGYPFNLSGSYDGEIFVEGMSFSSAMDLRTAPGGTLEGTYAVTSPVNMTGRVDGTLVADTARFSLSYVNPMDGCSGTLEGTGPVEEGGTAFSGRTRIQDSCNGYLSGSFRFRK